MTVDAHAPSSPDVRLGRLAQLGLLVGPLLSMVDSSVINVAVPDIARELHAGLATVQWAVSGYLLALGAALAATSFLARRFGTRQVYAASLLGFVAASACCAAAPNVAALIAARAAQGALGAPLVPLAMSMLIGKGDAARRIPASAGMLLFLAPALGPTLGGGLIAAGGWRWIFLINVPIGLLGLLGVPRIPADVVPERQPGARFDPMGLAMLAGGLTLALYGASQGAAHGWTTTPSLVPLGTGTALLAGYLGWAARREHPAVDLALLRNGQSALALFLSVLASVVAFSAVFLVPVFLQSVQGHSALTTGLAMLPQGVITGLGAVIGQRLLSRVTLRTIVVAGSLVLAVSSAGLLLLASGTPLWVTAAILSGRAAAIGLVITPLLFATLRTLRSEQLADANTLFNIVQRLGGSLGVSLLASFLAARAHLVGPVSAFHDVGAVLTAVAGLAAILSLLLAPVRQTEPVR